MPVRRPLPILLGSLALVVAGAAAAQTGPAPAAAPTVQADPASLRDIEFYLAHGEPDACGPGCNEWIVAQGKIDAGAAARLRRLLAKLGSRRPPIYFHSPGGQVAGSLELGRLIHEQKLEVRVGHTLVHDCESAKPADTKPADAGCEARKRSGEPIASELDPVMSMCNSGCVYAFAGGRVRAAPPSVRFGIHDVGLEASKTPLRAAVVAEAESESHAHIRAYMRDMGFDGALATASFAIPFESHKFLERDDIVRFGLDRREFDEDVWRFVDRTPPLVLKRFFVRIDGEQPHYLDASMSLDCGTGKALGVRLVRRHIDSGAVPKRSGISLNGRTLALPFLLKSGELDVSWGLVPLSAFDGIPDDATIVVPGTYLDRSNEATGNVTLNVVGFSAAYAKLRKRCDNPVTAATASFGRGATPPVQYLPTPPPSEMPGGMARAPLRTGGETQPTRQTSDAAGSSTQAALTPPTCGMQLAAAPQHMSGRVTGLVPDALALAGTRAVEAQLGGKISPAYLALKRASVALDPQGGKRTTMAAVPEHMAVQVGDLVELDTRYRDPSLPCNFIPWTINRRLDHE